MSTFTQLLDKRNGSPLPLRETDLMETISRISWKQVGEAAWGCSAFVLFLMLGPFSAVAALCGVASLAKQVRHGEPDSLC